MSRKIATGVLFVAAAASLGIYFSRGPWLAYREQKQKADTATSEMHKAEQEKNELLSQEAKLSSPMGREATVRSQGYRKSDEDVTTPVR